MWTKYLKRIYVNLVQTYLQKERKKRFLNDKIFSSVDFLDKLRGWLRLILREQILQSTAVSGLGLAAVAHIY